MNEGAPAGHGSISKEQLLKAFHSVDKDVDAKSIYYAWLSEQRDRSDKAQNPLELLKLRFETAETLKDIGMITDAREMFEDIAISAEEFGQPELLAKADAAIKALPAPTLH